MNVLEGGLDAERPCDMNVLFGIVVASRQICEESNDSGSKVS